MTNFQRIGSISNAQVGREFETLAQEFFSRDGLDLETNHKVTVGIQNIKKYHAFDLGTESPKVIVECKSHKWTAGNNVPSAKMTVWNEAMYYFHVAPDEYRKIFFVLRDVNKSRGESLAEYYIRTYAHLIPRSVEIWEYDTVKGNGQIVRQVQTL